MALNVVLIDPQTSDAIHTAKGLVGNEVLIVSDMAKIHGVFKTTIRTSAGTSIISSPRIGGGIVLTDMIMTSDRTNGSFVNIQFSDGTNNEVIAIGDSTNAPIGLAVSFGGRFHGWKDARLELITTGAVDASVTLGYYKFDNALDFAAWDALR